MKFATLKCNPHILTETYFPHFLTSYGKMKKEIANYGNPKISNNANITNLSVFVKIPTGIGVKVDVEFKLSPVSHF